MAVLAGLRTYVIKVPHAICKKGKVGAISFA